MKSTTTITEAEYITARSNVLKYLALNPFITNRILRALIPFEYDQAIRVLGRMCKEDYLERRGKAGSTHYVLITNEAQSGRRMDRNTSEGKD